MNTASLVSIILAITSFIGMLAVAFVQQRGQKYGAELTYKGDRLDLAFQAQEKQIVRLEKEVEDLMARATNAEARANTLDKELQECKNGRQQLEVQVEVLKLRLSEPR